MKDEEKTKAQLPSELEELRQRVTTLEAHVSLQKAGHTVKRYSLAIKIRLGFGLSLGTANWENIC